MKTLYYRVKITEVGRMVNDGFLIIEILKNEVISCRGIFTDDYVTSIKEDGNLILQYHKRIPPDIYNYETQLIARIPQNEIEIPLNVQSITNYLTIIKIETKRKITDKNEKKKCERNWKQLMYNVSNSELKKSD